MTTVSLCYSLIKMKYRLISASFVALLLLTVAIGLLNPGKAKALTSDQVVKGNLTWVDRAHIKATFGNVTFIFFDRDITDAGPIGDHKFNYVIQGYTDCPGATIDLSAAKNSANQWAPDLSKGRLDIKILPNGNVNDSCSKNRIQTVMPVQIPAGCPGTTAQGPPPSVCPNITFYAQSDSNTIANVDGDNKWVFTKSSVDPNEYIQNGNTNSCPNLLIVNGDQTSYQMYELTDNKGQSSGKTINSAALHLSKTCYQKWPDNTYMDMGAGLYPNQFYPLGKNLTIGTTQGGTSGTSPSGGSCESNGGSLSWVICPVIELMDNATNSLDSAIRHQLETPDPNASPQLKETWGRLRNIALIILVPIMLVMVIATALGFSFVDAYTVKRAMPRFLLAVMFISISWYVTAFLLKLTNTVGEGVLGLMTQPFGLADKGLGALISPASGATVSYGGLLVFGGLFLANVANLGVILSFVFVAVVALFLGFIVLVVRQVLIFALILLAPLAILSWIFPNNDDLWKLWWGTFSKLLLMYPLIIALIAAGRIGASIIPLQQGSDSLFTQILVIIAYVTPYFFIPATFKFAGGVFGSLAGVVNDRGRGLFDRSKKYRQEKIAKGIEDLKTGNRFRGGNDQNLRGRLNRQLQTATLLNKAGLRPTRVRENIATARGHRDFESAMKFLEENSTANAIKGDDDKMWAAMNGHDYQSVRQQLLDRAPARFSDPRTLEAATAEVLRFQREAGVGVGRIASTIAQAGTGTGYNYRSDGIDDDMNSAIIRASGGDRALQGRMLATMRPMLSQSGRIDMGGGGFAKNAIILDRLREAASNNGMASVRDANGDFVKDAAGNIVTEAFDVGKAREEIVRDVIRSNAGAAVAGKLQGVKNIIPVLKGDVDKALTSGDTAKAARELASLAGKYDAASQVAPQNAEALAQGVLAQKIDVTALAPDMRLLLTQQVDPRTGNVTYSTDTSVTYQQAIEALRGNPDFQTMRREYQTAGVAAAASAAAASTTGPVVPGGPIGSIPGAPPS